MIKRGIETIVAGVLALSLLMACQGGAITPANTTAPATATRAAESAVATSGVAGAGTATATETVAAATATATRPAAGDDAASADTDHGAGVPIVLDGNSVSVGGQGASASGSIVTINAAGTYNLQGSLTDGQIIVDTADDGLVRLILNDVDIRSRTSAPIYVAHAAAVEIVLADGTQNTLTDSTIYVLPDPASKEPNAALFSKADMTITGAGALTVHGHYNDGIASKDGLVIAGGAITVDAVDDGIRGKDYVVIQDGNLTVTAGGDGVKSDNDDAGSLGYITVEQGTVTVAAGGDGLAAEGDVRIAAGNFVITSGGGSANILDGDTSAKGIKGQARVTFDGGAFTIDAADDAIHSNGSIEINGGTFTIATGDDGIHADGTLTITGGVIDITRSVEGLESAIMLIEAGDIHVVSSDDGLNVAGDSGLTLDVHGGTIVIDAAGDGVDVNGQIDMTGGVIIVHGPTEQMNGALDFDAGFAISGGTVIAAGSAGMAQAPDASSSQNSVLIYFSTTQPAGSLVHLTNRAGENVLTFAPKKAYQSLAFSSPALVRGETYTIYVGGQATGRVQDGVYTGGSYSGGTQYASFTVSSALTQVGSGGRMRRPR